MACLLRQKGKRRSYCKCGGLNGQQVVKGGGAVLLSRCPISSTFLFAAKERVLVILR